MIRGNNEGLGPELFPRIIVEVAKVDVGEVQLGDASGVDAQADAAAGQRFPDMILMAVVPEVTGAGERPDQMVIRILQRFVVLAEASLTAAVNLGRFEHPQRLVGPQVIVGVLPT